MPHRGRFIPGHQSDKQQAEYNTLAMDALYDQIIEFFRHDPLLHDANDGSITARILTAETVYHPTTYQPHGVLITLKDVKRTQYMLRIERVNLTTQLPTGATLVEAHNVETKQLPPMSSEQRADAWRAANKEEYAIKEEYNSTLDPSPIIDVTPEPVAPIPNEPDQILALAEIFRPKRNPDFWMLMPIDEAGYPLYYESYRLGESDTVHSALQKADDYLEYHPLDRMLILEGFR